MTDTEFEGALQGLRNPPPEALAVLRARVLARVERKRPWAAWLWAAAAAAAVVMAGVVLYTYPSAPIAPPVVAFHPPAAPAILAASPAPLKPRRLARRRLIATAETMQIKMLTDDPNVIIIWLIDKKRGDSL